MLGAGRRVRLKEVSGVTCNKSPEQNERIGVENSGESGGAEGSQSHRHGGEGAERQRSQEAAEIKRWSFTLAVGREEDIRGGSQGEMFRGQTGTIEATLGRFQRVQKRERETNQWTGPTNRLEAWRKQRSE